MPQSLYELFTGKRAQTPGGDMLMGGGLQPTQPDMGMSELSPEMALRMAQPQPKTDAAPAPNAPNYRNLPGMPGSFENINAMANAGPSMKGGASGGSSGLMKLFGGG